MPKAIATIITVFFLASAPASAGAEACGAALSAASPFYCQLEALDSVRLQLKGSAEALGANRRDLEEIMRERTKGFLAALPRPAARPTASPIAKRPHRGQLFCALWTVGQDASVALFVECALQSASTGDSVEARLLGRTTADEFDMATRIALGRVVSKVTDDYRAQREQRIALSAKQRIKTAGPSR